MTFLDFIVIWHVGPSQYGGHWRRLAIGHRATKEPTYVQIAFGHDEQCPFTCVPGIVREVRGGWRATHVGAFGLWLSYNWKESV